MRFWSGPGAPKGRPPKGCDRPFSDHFRPIEKMASKKASKNRSRKSIENVCQKAPKMMPKWIPKALIFHTLSKKAKTLQTLCFTISKLQSKSAPCQSEVLVLKKGFDAKECDLENCAPPLLPHPNSSEYGKMHENM